MTPWLPEHLAAFQRALAIAEREARALASIHAKLASAPPRPDQLEDLDPGSELAERIETFGSRFARFQDQLGEKLLPALLRLLGEPERPMLDTLNRAEKLGLLNDALSFGAWRNLRNRLVHEYLQDAARLAQAVAESLLAAPQLTVLLERIREDARTRGIPLE